MIFSFTIWIKLVDWELDCNLKTYTEILYQSKKHGEPISHLFNEILIWQVSSTLLLSAHITAVCVVLFFIHIKAEYEHGRKVGFSPFLEYAGCGS